MILKLSFNVEVLIQCRELLSAGLGLYEYMQLCEELKTEPIWVINNGISHQESLPTAQVLPWINDTLDSIEFITGSPNSTWGSVRANMGHPEPWGLRYVAIGNEVSQKGYKKTDSGLTWELLG